MGWGAVASAGISALASIGGGLLQNSSNRESIEAASLANDKAYERQKEFAQNGIRWRVADAKAAGLHPLAALGAQGSFYTPSGNLSFGGQDYGWLSDAGQSIGRAVEAGLSAKERAEMQAVRDEAARVDLDTRKANLENQQLQNQSLKMDMVRQLARDAERATVNQQLGPAFPNIGRDGRVMPGQGDALSGGLFKVKPAELVASHPQTPFAEAGTNPELKFVRTASGGYAPVRSSAVEEALEDDWLGGARFNVRNALGSALSDNRYAPPRSYLPNNGRDGHYWLFDNVTGDWFPAHPSESKWLKFRRTLGFDR